MSNKITYYGFSSYIPFYGYPRMKIALKDEGFDINHKKVYQLMTDMNIRAEVRKKRNFFFGKPSVIYSNLLNRNFKALEPDEKYVTEGIFKLEIHFISFPLYSIFTAMMC